MTLHGDGLDRAGTPNKIDLYNSVKEVYHLHGDRLQYLEIDLDKKIIMWKRCAPWQMVSQKIEKNADGDDQAVVAVTLKNWASPTGAPIDLTMDGSHFF